MTSTTNYISVSYRLDDKQTGDTIRDISMSWSTRPVDEVRDNLNTWLVACGFDLVVVDKPA